MSLQVLLHYACCCLTQNIKIATIFKFSISGLLTTQLVQVTCSFSEDTTNKNPYARNIACALKPQSNPTAFKVTRGHDSFPIPPCCCLCQQAGAAGGIGPGWHRWHRRQQRRGPQHRAAGGVCSPHALQSLVGRLVFIHGTVRSNLLYIFCKLTEKVALDQDLFSVLVYSMV